MTTIKDVLNKKNNILSVYFTAGFPKLEDTGKIIKELEKNGVDLIEVGIPFSDPIADGPTIQKSSNISLQNGMNLDIVFEQLEQIKDEVNTPLILMGYLNQMLAYGEERFLKICKSVNIQSLIIPDLPISEYRTTYKTLFDKYGLSNIFLISPQTSIERIQEIDELSSEFIYMVSSNAVTGSSAAINIAQIDYFERISELKLKNKVLIGFGIHNNETFRQACKYSAGAIIGSAFINKISQTTDLELSIKEFVEEIRKI